MWKNHTQNEIDKALEWQIKYGEIKDVAEYYRVDLERVNLTPSLRKITKSLRSARKPKTCKDLKCNYRSLIKLWHLGLIVKVMGAKAIYIHPSLQKHYDGFLLTSMGKAA